MISSADFTRPLPGAGCGWHRPAHPRRGPPPGNRQGTVKIVSGGSTVAVSVQFCWPPAFKNLAVCVQDLVAADNRPTRHGHRRGLTRRPRPDRLLGQTATKGQAPAGQLHPAPARQAGRAMSALRGPPTRRRPAATVPARMGTMVATGHPQGDSRGLPRPPRATWPTGQRSNPPRAHLLPPRATRPPPQDTSTVNLHAPAACLSRMPR